MHSWAKVISLVLLCAAISKAYQPAHAQEGNKATVESLFIPQISPASGNPDHEWEDIGPAMELGDALKKTAAWHKKFPDSLRLTREFEVQRRNVPRAPRQEKTDEKLPDLISTVRPGSPEFSKDKKANESSAKPLAGQTVTGTIGNDKVEIEFKGTGEKGTFSVTGQMKGNGKWQQLGKFLMMETDYAKYDGVIEKDSRVSGNRTVKETGERVRWSGWIKKADNAKAPASRDNAPRQTQADQLKMWYQNISGTYYRNDGSNWYELRQDGTYVFRWTDGETEAGRFGPVLLPGGKYDYRRISTTVTQSNYQQAIGVTLEETIAADFSWIKGGGWRRK